MHTSADWIGIVVFLLYMLVCVYIGYWAMRRAQVGLYDYFVASGTIGSVVIFFTALGTLYSAFSFLGGPGFIYGLGITGLVFYVGLLLDVPLIVFLGRRMWALSARYQYVTPGDLIADRFEGSNAIRAIIAVIAIFFTIFYITIQIVGCGLVVSTLSHNLLSYKSVLVIVAVLMGSYIVMGGMRGVAWTDSLQSILLIGGILLATGYAISHSGGVTQAFQTAYEKYPKQFQLVLPPLLLITTGLGAGIGIMMLPQAWVRVFAAKKKGGILGMAWGQALGTLVIGTCGLIIAFIGMTLFAPGTIKQDTVILKIFDFMPSALAGPFMAAGVAAAMSTADSVLLMVAAMFSRDIYQKLIRPKSSPEHLTTVGKISAAAVVVIAIWTALTPPEYLMRFGLDLYFPGFLILLPVLTGALFWKRANKQGALASLIGGFIVLVLTTFVWKDALNIWSGIWSAGIGFIILFIVGFLAPPPSREVVDKFHGFLGAVNFDAVETQEDVMKLKIEPAA